MDNSILNQQTVANTITTITTITFISLPPEN